MAPDGATVDFADAWSKTGWGTFMPLLAHLANPETRDLSRSADPCFVHRFFSNKYYHHGLADPWNIHPALAQDWHAIAGRCAQEGQLVPPGVSVRAWEHGGWGSLRIGEPGATLQRPGARRRSLSVPPSRPGRRRGQRHPQHLAAHRAGLWHHHLDGFRQPAHMGFWLRHPQQPPLPDHTRSRAGPEPDRTQHARGP